MDRRGFLVMSTFLVFGTRVRRLAAQPRGHEASLTLPAVREAIQKGRPMIAGFGERHITTPLGGQGLPL